MRDQDLTSGVLPLVIADTEIPQKKLTETADQLNNGPITTRKE